ncbi:MAG: hypothetical protein CME15_08860 [Gemmatimonadetes bacterium]|jgi:hypothetical protein|nr:hypothetical protein [Gemmatimonadota bacterium]
MRLAVLTTILLSSSAWAQSGDSIADGEAEVTGVWPGRFAEVEVMVVFDGTGFGEIAVIGFFDTERLRSE